MSNDLLVITPSYNERENLEVLVGGILGILPTARILVVDDNSPDGSGALLRKLADRDNRIEVLSRPRKLGLASAYADGFRHGLNHGYRRFVQMDADLSHDPGQLSGLLAALDEGADLAIGSRRVSGGGISGWPLRRQLLSRWANFYARTVLGVPVRDLTSGFRAMRRSVIEAVDLGGIRSEGYSFLIEMAYRAHLDGFRVVEEPIMFTDRRSGRSKLGPRICLEAVWMVPHLRLARSRLVTSQHEPGPRRPLKERPRKLESIGSASSCDPLFSVVIATYGRAHFVTQTVESVLRQTESSYEIIVVDDGSTDNTRQALAVYGDRIRYLFQENQGMAAARNRGIRQARGEFVAILDSDDIWEPDYLAAARRVFERNPETGAVFVAEREIDAHGTRRPRVYGKRTDGRWFTPIGMISTDTRVGSGRPPVVRRALLTEFGGYDERLCGAWDSELWIRMSFDVRMAAIPEPLVLRRRHQGNYSADKLKDGKGWLVILDRLGRERPEFVRENFWALQRVRSKSHLRIGRSLLARCAEEPELVPETRRHLARALLLYPLFVRAWSYLAISCAAPSAYEYLHGLGARVVQRMNLGPNRLPPPSPAPTGQAAPDRYGTGQ